MAEVKIHNAEKLMRMLQTLPKELTANKRGGVVAQSMRKGANLIHKEAKKNLQRAIAIHGDESTGLLMKNLKVRRKRYEGKGERFTVGVGNKRYPIDGKTITGKNGKTKPATVAGAKTTKLSGQRLEYGTSHQKAAPWIRPAFTATAETAINTITSDLEKGLDKIASNLLKG